MTVIEPVTQEFAEIADELYRRSENDMMNNKLRALMRNGGLSILRLDLRFRKFADALAECVAANDELHNALCNDSESEPRHHEIFVSAQRRETAAIENARKLLAEVLSKN